MNVWLASYPRSGNTLLRILLFECFGLFVGSKYSETTDDPQLVRLKCTLGYGAAHRNGGLAITKTHDHPEDDAPSVYVVRNGLAVVASYAHFLRTFDQPVSAEDIIAGNVAFGGWSDHVAAWTGRPRTLLLRFEDVCTAPDAAVQRLAAFLDREPAGHMTSDFTKLQAIDARFFRSGSNERNIAELTEAQRAAFMARHGATMSAMGY